MSIQGNLEREMDPKGMSSDQEAPLLDQSMVCMSVVEDGPRISFAAYNEETNLITLEESYANGCEVQNVIEGVLLALQPTLLLVSNQVVANDKLIGLLTKPPSIASFSAQNPSNSSTDKISPGSIPYRALKSSCFDFRSCRDIILQKLRVRSLRRMSSRTDEEQAELGGDSSVPLSMYHALATVINFESKNQVQALGSLLSFLSDTAFRLANHDDSTNDYEGSSLIVVSDVVRANTSMFMTVSPETLASLHIFSTEHHPLSVARGTGNSKEGFSLFSLLDRTTSHVGRVRMKEWMMKPLIDCEAIQHRQNGVQLFLQQEMGEAKKNITELIAEIAAVEKIFARLNKCSAKPYDFVSLLLSFEAACEVFDVLEHQVAFVLQQLLAGASKSAVQDENETEDQPIGSNLISSLQFVESLLSDTSIGLSLAKTLAGKLREALDVEATDDSTLALIFRPDYDEELTFWDSELVKATNALSLVKEELSQTFPNLADFIDVAFFPQLGFHIVLKNGWEENGTLPEEFNFLFNDAEGAFYKTAVIEELDESYGDIDVYRKAREASLRAELEEDLLENVIELQKLFNTIGDIDCTLAFASCAREFGYARPTMVRSTESCIEIRNGRHPLQELLLKNFVPNDTSMNQTNRVHVLTGPNYSGKSCYARQVGILVYMAHIGSFIPCDEARISVVQSLFVRFSAIETCSVPQSSFQLDLSQMGTILHRAGKESLVIIDEFGKGTSPASGIALLAAVVKFLVEKKALAVITTHFLEIFSMQMIRDGEDGIKASQMVVEIPKNGRQMAYPVFRLTEGVTSSSAGLVCAKMARLRPAVLDRATEIVQASRNKRRVQPLTEIVRDSIRFTDTEKRTFRAFLRTEWSTATMEDIDSMLEAFKSDTTMERDTSSHSEYS